MSRLSPFMYAESAVQIGPSPAEQKFQITGPLQVILPLYIPGTFSFCIVFGITEMDLSVQHKIRVVFKKQDSLTPIVDTHDAVIGPFTPPTGAGATLPLESQGFMSSVGLQNVDFKTPGIYVTTIYLDGEELGSEPIDVIKRNDNGTSII